MLNHLRPRETKWQYAPRGEGGGEYSPANCVPGHRYDDSKNAFTITSLRALGAGAQVYDSYGKKCNSRFLLNYGVAWAVCVSE